VTGRGGPRRDAALGRRLVSAAVGLPVLAAAVLLGWPATAAAAAVAALAAGREVARLAAARGAAARGGAARGAAGGTAVAEGAPHAAASGAAGAEGAAHGVAGRAARAALTLIPLGAVAAGIGVAGRWPVVTGAAIAGTAVLVAGALASVVFRSRSESRGALRPLAVAAALYFGGLLAFAAPLSAHGADGRLWLAFALLVTFAVDTAAYATGRAIGRRKLAPSISPGKTWEGVAGGLLAGAAAGAALAALLPTLASGDGFSLTPAPAAALGVLLAITATAGDLAESWLKRRAGVKDAGGLIPGHGGFLDRLDSLAPNLAIVYYVQIWAGG
jgi:phosphatidate cytidylyltransferase